MCVCGSKATMGTTDSENKHQNRHVRRRRRRKQQLPQWWESVFVQELNFWHIDFPQKCKQSMCVCGSKETMETTDSDNKQQNRHARRRRRWTTITTDDANQHLYTSNAHGCSTLAHRLFQKIQQSMCECGATIRTETTESDDKQQNRHARRRRRWKTVATDDANQHLYTSNSHGCSTLAHRLFTKNAKVNVRMWS